MSQGRLKTGPMYLACGMAWLSLAAGCATRDRGPDTDRYLVDSARGNEQNAELYTDLIEQLIRQDKLYAAHAHLEQRQAEFGHTQQLSALDAEILRRMGKTQKAETIYRELLDSRYAAEAYHGLGLIEADRAPDQSLAYLRQAVARAPTNSAMRNDLGYAELLAGHVAQARTEIATAYQLEENSQLATNNYVLVLLVTENHTKAAQVAKQAGMSPERFESLKSQAHAMNKARSAPNEPVETQSGEVPGTKNQLAGIEPSSGKPGATDRLQSDRAEEPNEPIAANPGTAPDQPTKPARQDNAFENLTSYDGTSNAVPFSTRELNGS